MDLDHLDYDGMIQESLRGIVRKALEVVSVHGLPGNHHFYITFRTDRGDVVVPDYLREKHSDEITIVLQHQFWDLKIDDKKFSVCLSFNGVQETLVIPFNAIVSFMDPSVKFGLQFIPEEGRLTDPSGPTSSSPSDSKDKKAKKGADGKGTNIVRVNFGNNQP